MKKFIIIVAIIATAYHFKPGIFSGAYSFLDGKGAFSFMKDKGAFDEQGNPLTLVFIHNQCGAPCDDAVKLLKKRRIDFSLYGLDDSEENMALWKEYGGVNSFPNIVIGNDRVYGSYKSRIASALALNYGQSVLTRTERYYMKKHFNADGSERLVMYGASWCGYCKKMREELESNNIDYIEIDVEKSSQRKAMTKALDISGYPLMYFGYKRMSGPKPSDVLALF